MSKILSEEAKIMFVNRLLSVVISCAVSVVCGLSIGTSPATASPQDRVVTVEDFETQKVYSPYAGRAYADQVFFGDTHFHTKLSPDAGLIGTMSSWGEAVAGLVPIERL